MSDRINDGTSQGHLTCCCRRCPQQPAPSMETVSIRQNGLTSMGPALALHHHRTRKLRLGGCPGSHRRWQTQDSDPRSWTSVCASAPGSALSSFPKMNPHPPQGAQPCPSQGQGCSGCRVVEGLTQGHIVIRTHKVSNPSDLPIIIIHSTSQAASFPSSMQ